jgi:hypothetical protein
MNESMYPTGLPAETSGTKQDVDPSSRDDKACLARIDNMRQAALREPDNIPAILQYFAAGNLELDLRFMSGVRQMTAKQVNPLHEMPELSQMLAPHYALSRQYQRDLDLAERFKQSKRKSNTQRQLNPTAADFKAAEKPR